VECLLGAHETHFHQALIPTRRAWTRRSGVEGEQLPLLREQTFSARAHALRVSIKDSAIRFYEERAGQAVSYALKNWAALTRYLEDGDLSYRQQSHGAVVARHLGRAEQLTFVGSDRGGKTMAVLRRFVASCELAKWTRSPGFRTCSPESQRHLDQRLDELLPHRWAPAYSRSFSADPTLTKS